MVLGAVVFEESVNCAGDSVLEGRVLEGTNGKIENIALDLAIVGNWVAVSKLD